MKQPFFVSLLLCALSYCRGSSIGLAPSARRTSSAKSHVGNRLTSKAFYTSEDLQHAIVLEDVGLITKILDSNTATLTRDTVQFGIFARNAEVIETLLLYISSTATESFNRAHLTFIDMALSSVKNRGSSWHLVDCLLKHGHKPSLTTLESLISNRNNDEGLRKVLPYFTQQINNSLMAAFFKRNQDDDWIVAELIKLGENVNGTVKYSVCPYLYQAVQARLYRTASVLLRLGADVNTKFILYDFNQSTLQLALSLDRLDFFSLLVEHGADTSSSGSWSSKHQIWLALVTLKKVFMLMFAGTVDQGSSVFMFPLEIVREIFLNLTQL